MSKRKTKPLHQLARDKQLTPHDARELQRFREYLRSNRTPADYKRIYPEFA